MKEAEVGWDWVGWGWLWVGKKQREEGIVEHLKKTKEANTLIIQAHGLSRLRALQEKAFRVERMHFF